MEEDGSVTYDEDTIQNKLIEHYKSMAWETSPHESRMYEEIGAHTIFNEQEVAEAMDHCNFSKGIGPDGFDGLILSKDLEIKSRVVKEIS